MNRRGFLLGGLAGLLVAPVVVKETIADAVEVAADYISSTAEAGERKVYADIGEYYDSGVAEDVMPGARRCNADRIEDQLLGFKGNEWMDLYFGSEYGAALQEIFNNLDGQLVEINSPSGLGNSIKFDFKEFHNYLVTNRNETSSVTLWYDGFMSFGSTYDSIVIPINSSVVSQIEKL
jgi:hypothetical protein